MILCQNFILCHCFGFTPINSFLSVLVHVLLVGSMIILRTTATESAGLLLDKITEILKTPHPWLKLIAVIGVQCAQ